MRALAGSAIIWAGATPYFFVFWRWFDFWRRHRVATYSLMLGTLGALGLAIYRFSDLIFAHAVSLPAPLRAAGWLLIAGACLLALVADRQIGLRVRSFTPFFEPHGRIELRTHGAYGIVRHPIYAAGIGYQLGVFLVSGQPAVAVAAAVLAVGAIWFTRQEERRLRELLEDPTEYDRYRARVPALLPWSRRPR